MQTLHFSVQAASICSPATGSIPCAQTAQQAQWIEDHDEQAWRPDDSFMPKGQLRRLSRMSKMALYTASHASQSANHLQIGPPIFCSRYGEFKHTVNVLDSIHTKDLVSPMDFSYAVHNTAQGLFSILHKDTRPATALCGRENIIEEALTKAYAQLHQGDEAALVVYQEDTLPALYKDFTEGHLVPLSLAMVVSKPRDNDKNKLTLSFKAQPSDTGIIIRYNRREQKIAQMFLKGSGHMTAQSKRMEWSWLYETL